MNLTELERLEREATSGPWEAAARNALPQLIRIARASKAMCDAAHYESDGALIDLIHAMEGVEL